MLLHEQCKNLTTYKWTLPCICFPIYFIVFIIILPFLLLLPSCIPELSSGLISFQPKDVLLAFLPLHFYQRRILSAFHWQNAFFFPIFVSFMVIKYIYCKIHHFKHFSGESAVALGTFMMSATVTAVYFQNFSITLNRNSITIKQYFRITPTSGNL